MEWMIHDHDDESLMIISCAIPASPRMGIKITVRRDSGWDRVVDIMISDIRISKNILEVIHDYENDLGRLGLSP